MQRRGLGCRVRADLGADLLAGDDGLVYRSRAEEQRRGDPGEKLDPLTFGSGEAGVLRRLLPSARGRGRVCSDPVKVGPKAKRPTESELVARPFKDGKHALDDSVRFVRCEPRG